MWPPGLTALVYLTFVADTRQLWGLLPPGDNSCNQLREADVRQCGPPMNTEGQKASADVTERRLILTHAGQWNNDVS